MPEVSETMFMENKPTAEGPSSLQKPTEDGGISIHDHAKKLCVNKVGHTMVVPSETPVSFLELFSRHRLKTISYCSVFWSFGMCVAFLGPTLLDLECRIESVFSTMSWIFFSQSLFILIGVICGGFIVQRFSNNTVLLVSTVMISVTLSLIPACSVLAWLAVTLAVMGFFMGTIDTVANISMIELYGRNVAPFLQALHFFYGLGAFVAPMIAEPFLLNKDCSELILNSTMTPPSHQRHRMLERNSDIQEISEAQHHSRIQYAFWILAAMQIPVICLFIALVIHDIVDWGKSLKNPTAEPDVTAGDVELDTHVVSSGIDESYWKKDDDESFKITKKQVVLVTVFTSAIIFLYDGLQVGYGGYLFSYAVKSIEGMSMNEAAYLNACYWGTFAFGRLISIGIATKLDPSIMLIGNITGCMFAMTLMLFFRHNHNVLYAGTVVFGLFLSSIYPTAVSLAETYIHVTSFITSILVGGASAGEMIIPVIIGHEFEAFGPVSLLISGVVMTIVSLFIYIILYSIGNNIKKHSSE